MKITSQDQWSRRKAIAAGLGFATTPSIAQAGWLDSLFGDSSVGPPNTQLIDSAKHIEGITTFAQYRGYSNMYEFGTSKTDPAKYEHEASHLSEDWTVDFNGTVVDIDQLMGVPFEQLNEEVFNFRCVEAWGMRVHYNGFPLSALLERYGDTSKKYVSFISKVDEEAYRGQGGWSTLNWPYVEAITMAEAMHPLTWAVFGNYGIQSVANGAPFRVNIPWKYGYKSPKAIVKVICTDTKPSATWNRLAPNEYSWHSNVYPNISHPRWSQATHRMILEDGTSRTTTERYNGYAEDVSHLYPLSDDNY